MPDYTTFTRAQLIAELRVQAAAHEAAGRERRAIVEEMENRNIRAKAKAALNALSPGEREALKEELNKP